MRRLSELEIALLRAIAELGDEAYGVKVRQRAERYMGCFLVIGRQYVTLNRLEEEGFVRSFDVDNPQFGRPRRYWRPAFDLTEVLNGT